jgi:hypothetical protein
LSRQITSQTSHALTKLSCNNAHAMKTRKG